MTWRADGPDTSSSLLVWKNQLRFITFLRFGIGKVSSVMAPSREERAASQRQNTDNRPTKVLLSLLLGSTSFCPQNKDSFLFVRCNTSIHTNADVSVRLASFSRKNSHCLTSITDQTTVPLPNRTPKASGRSFDHCRPYLPQPDEQLKPKHWPDLIIPPHI